jgi:phenylalanyl-tRNA synthetase beta chain
MGGAETEVTGATTEVLIESAHFHSTRVRRTARRLGLSTDASYRFERGVDREGTRRAADRAARLLAEVAGGVVAAGTIEVRGAAPPGTGTIRLDPARVNRLLGTALTPAEVAACLARIDVPAAPEADGGLRCTIPSHRNDLHIPEDLIEEVARVHGYDRIAPPLPEGPLVAVQAPPDRALMERARDALRASGLTEIMTLGILRAEAFDRLALPEGDPRRRTVRVLNPILEGEVHLRTTLLPCLLEAARWNRARQVETVRLFEISRVFRPRDGVELPEEPVQIAALLIEGETPRFWEARSETPLFFRAKGVAEALLADLGYEASFSAGSAEPYLHPGAASTITVAGRVTGAVGELHPEVVARFELGVPCAVLEVDLRTLLELPPREIRFREVSRQPSVRRDLAVVLPEDVAAGEVQEAIRKTAGPELVSAEVFDRYQGPGVAEGRVSLAFRLRFQRPDRTLTDAEVARATERVVQMLAHRFGGELR